MSKKKILVLVPFPMDDDSLAMRQAQSEYLDLGPDIQIDYRPVKWAGTNFVGPYDYVLGDFTMLEAGLSAQDDGYDAVCIDTMSDSGVAALRAVLDIPVVGAGRSSMLMALMLGERFSILSMWSHWRHLYSKTLKDLNMVGHCASVRAIDIQPDNQSLLSGKEDEVFPLLAEAARLCIEEDGAEVIVLGSTTMHQAHAYLCEHLEVPVINPGPLTYKLAEGMLALGLSHSRKAYPRSPAPKHQVVRAMLDAAGEFEH